MTSFIFDIFLTPPPPYLLYLCSHLYLKTMVGHKILNLPSPLHIGHHLWMLPYFMFRFKDNFINTFSNDIVQNLIKISKMLHYLHFDPVGKPRKNLNKNTLFFSELFYDVYKTFYSNQSQR